MEEFTPTIVLLGKVGHGKTRVLNELCGTSFDCSMAESSSTTDLQSGRSLTHDIKVVDTPGFCSSNHTSKNTACQKRALESGPLAGVFLVVKFERGADMAATVSTMMNFVGDSDVRIIITFVDGISCADREDAIIELSSLLELNPNLVLTACLQTDASDIEDHIKKSLHAPRMFQTSSDHEALINTFHVGARKLFGHIDSICSATSDEPSDQGLLDLGNSIICVASELSLEEKVILIQQLELSKTLSKSERAKATLSKLIDKISFVEHYSKRTLLQLSDLKIVSTHENRGQSLYSY